METKELVLTLSCVQGIGAKTLNMLLKPSIVEVGDLQGLYEYINGVTIPRFNPKKIDKNMLVMAYDKALNILENSYKQNVGCITKFDELYPDNFKTIKDPTDAPSYFFYKGNANCLNTMGVSIIGTREVSDFGFKCGQRIAQVIAEKGYTIVSGLAKGCDTSAHKGCVDAGKPTVAILSHGLDIIYPRINMRLAQQILEENGCLLSEYPIGTPVSAYNLVARDRLQAYLADGVIVVETGLKGGTYHAFNKAVSENRPVAVIAYNEAHYAKFEHSQGNKNLIENGTAFPLVDNSSIDEFLKLLTRKGSPSDASENEQQSLF